MMIDPTDRPERPTYGVLHAPPEPKLPPSRGRPIAAWIIAAVLLAFAIGMVASPWFENSVRSRLPGARASDSDIAKDEALAALQARLDALETRTTRIQPRVATAPGGGGASLEMQAATEVRLAELQAQVAELQASTDSTVAAAEEGAERAQTALLVAALRRGIEGGQRLDVYEPALRARFGASHPNEVAALLALGRRPLTATQLAQSLARTLPTVERAEAENRSWWDGVKHNLAGIADVRRADEIPRDAAASLRLAAQRAGSGDIDGALRAVAVLPVESRRPLDAWRLEARRYVAGLNALAALEATALMPAAAP
ncbi:hypothetical protein ACFOMD_18310 [Sphingoaurantiacus capsulatus]|uniref:Inner membrane protein n=1 Tax=Sphingoaurantiacus capsulatus TaxID=1771310 RepID=A0ABV7XE99_9SPHN